MFEYLKFEFINNQGVRSGDGKFILQRMDRYFYHYVSGSHVLKIDVEPGLRMEEIFLQPDMHWEPPNDSIAISPSELTRIRKDVSDALKFMRTPYTIKA